MTEVNSYQMTKLEAYIHGTVINLRKEIRKVNRHIELLQDICEHTETRDTEVGKECIYCFAHLYEEYDVCIREI